MNKKDLEFLLDLETFIYEIGTGHMIATEKNTAPYFHRLYKLNEKLDSQRKINNEKTKLRNREKRKQDKNYGRKKRG